ncbi:MAG: N-acetylglucosamine-6-phosphate deacetylase [Lachnospiraceae bacterium]|nr:N-acetylglucosamine-6-phosphate deacetylase [Lachnospiraceae bacterium]
MILKNGMIMDENFQLRRCDIQISEGQITAIGEDLTDGEASVDMTGKYILPGFIDSHMHGAVGSKISDSDPDLCAITRYEVTQGVTSIALSTVCTEYSLLLRQIDRAVEASRTCEGAKIAAIHAEGPFINRKKKGAMEESAIISPDIQKLDEMIEHGCGMLKLITLAPEVPGALEVIRHAAEKGLTVSMGHTDATYDEAMAAIDAGASQSTHTFNAMRALSHREPGVLGAALTDPRVRCEMICDHTHLHPGAIKLIYRAKGADRINIISDSEHGAGINADKIEFDGEVRYIVDGVMKMEDGTIAGSASSLLFGIQNLIKDGIPLTDISKMASLNPAKTLKIDHLTGSIAVGKAADLAVLDGNYNIDCTYVDGVCVYKA